MRIGFSTGSLALSDVRKALQMVAGRGTNAVELSALREEELKPLIGQLDSLDLHQFKYVSFHAPSSLRTLREPKVVELLQGAAEHGWPIILHPDVINDFACWQELGGQLCIENMDKRKPIGQTARDLGKIFAKLPDARLCFDIGHARQVDPTMTEAASILRRFGSRIGQIHMSFVNSRSDHEPLNFESMLAFRRVAQLMPVDAPVILETPVHLDEMDHEIAVAKKLVNCFRGAVASRAAEGVTKGETLGVSPSIRQERPRP